jgi:signal transduction histidine kinase/ActR/RegA family two-component response regulator
MMQVTPDQVDDQRAVRRPHKGISLRTRLAALVILSVVPLLAFSFVGQYLQYRQAFALTSEQTLQLARSISNVVDQDLRARIAALEVLAQSSKLQAGDIDGFRAEAEATIAQQFPGSNVILLREDGQQLMNTLLAPGAKLPVRPNLESLRRAFATGQPVVSDLYTGAIGPRPVVAVDVPVRRADGSIAYVLSSNPRLEDFAAMMLRQRLPANRVVSLYDRRGTILARVPNAQQFVGRQTGARQLAVLSSQREGTYEATSRDGIPVVAAFSHSEQLGWAVAVGVPRAELLAPALEGAARTLFAGGLLVALSLVLAVVAARRIAGPIATLGRIAAATDGEAAVRAGPTGMPEADNVVHALRSAELGRRSSEHDQELARAALDESEERLRQAQKMEAVGQLTGGLAHDFNNLLLVIIGNLEMLLDSPKADPALKPVAMQALEAAERGADLTRSLLAFARRQPLRPRSVALNKLVRDITALLSRTLGERIEVKLDLARDVWPVVVDPAQLEAALANLATNARDAMPQGGRLTIASADRHLDDDYCAQHPDVAPGDYAMIEVSDTGIGIAPEIMPQIFDPFFTTKELGRGTGLGLSMVFGFMKQSGGHINVYSEPNVGTTFRLYLPRDKEAATGEERKAGETPIAGGGETILVVEDNPSLRQLVRVQLTSLRYRVQEAENAEAALKVMESGERIDLLFADIVMPGKLDGYELVRVVRERWPAVKIVLTSGFPGTSREQDAADFADTPLLTKPYRRSDLAQTISRVLAGSAK